MQKFEFVFWDFDGTLFDTYPHIASIIIETMKSEYNLDLNVKNIENWAKKILRIQFNPGNNILPHA